MIVSAFYTLFTLRALADQGRQAGLRRLLGER